MKFSKVLLILGIALFIVGALTPADYAGCHGDLQINSQTCYPDFVYETGQAAFYVGIVSILISFYLMKKERDKSLTDIIFKKSRSVKDSSTD